MRRGQTRQTFKLRLLAFVLAFAILWYILNPAPRPIARIKREEKPPDEKKREAEPQLQREACLPIVFRPLRAGSGNQTLPIQDEDEFDWPDLIDG